MISSSTMRLLEDSAEFYGVSKNRLMENAGKAVAGEIGKKFRLSGKRIAIVCGQGNNGGDGFVAARELGRTANVKVIFLGREEKLSPEAKKAFSKLGKKIVFGKERLDLINNADCIIDAMLGTGVKGKIREPVKTAIKKFNKSKALKISIDLPSGIDPDSGKGKPYAEADLIVTFHDLKKGLARFKNKAAVVDIGIPKMRPKIVSAGDVKKCFPRRKLASHKGDNGKVLVIGGSRDLVGAPALAAMTALAVLRAGVDLAVVAAPEKCGYVINTYSPDIIVRKFSGDFFTRKHSKGIIALAKGFDAVLIGPGIGREKQTMLFVKEIVKKIKSPLILDADAIKAVKGMKFNGKVLLTPHAAEFSIFSGKNPAKNKELVVKEAAGKHNCVILLKGRTDVISNGHATALNRTGNAGMTVGGTGDVLAGICTALAALGNDLFRAAYSAAFINGRIGDRLLKKKGHGFTASDFIELIPGEIKPLAK